uniref:SEC63 domain-containing protein n=1 Tax=Timema cristinae TaxID=61476 RepID=A0A7R9CVY4_TIMCR|nr:unnamed protein product [Timema cristinae]
MMAKEPRHTIPNTLSDSLYLYGFGCEPNILSFNENVLDYFEWTTRKYMFGESWATIKETLESEAISTATMKPLVKKYYDLAGEITGHSEHITQDETAAFLFRLYFKEPGSFPRTRILQFVLGEVPASTVHKVFQNIDKIASCLPDYTVERLHQYDVPGKIFDADNWMSTDELTYETIDISKLEDDLLEFAPETDDEYEAAVSNVLVALTTTPNKMGHISDTSSPFSCFHNIDDIAEELHFSFSTDTRKEDIAPISTMILDVGRNMFGKMKSFNAVESQLFSLVYESYENLLIVTPLGTSKFNIILLAVLKLVVFHQALNPELKKLRNPTFSFKLANELVVLSSTAEDGEIEVLYLVSSEVVASHIAHILDENLSREKLVARHLISCEDFDKSDVGKAHVWVTTPEKWDSLTRLRDKEVLLQTIQLVVVDDMSCLEDKSSVSLDAILARTRLQVSEPNQEMLKMLGFVTPILPPPLVALGNLREFLDVRVEDDTSLFMSGTVRLVGVKGETVTDVQDRAFDRCYAYIRSVLLRRGSKVIIFTANKELCDTLAESLGERARCTKSVRLFTPVYDSKLKNRLHGLSDEDLRKGFLNGFLRVHAEMAPEERELVMASFNDGLAQVLIATPDLTWEKEMSQVHSLVFYDVGNSEECTALDMMKSLNRNIFRTTFGISNTVILTNHAKFGKYSSFIKEPPPLASDILSTLPDLLNTEISLGNVTSLKSARKWLTSTYWYTCVKATSQTVKGDDLEEVEDVANSVILDTLQLLLSSGLVKYASLDDISSTELGSIACSHSLSYENVVFLDNISKEAHTIGINDMGFIFDVICRSPEFSKQEFRDETALFREALSWNVGSCHLEILSPRESAAGTLNFLLQMFLSQDTSIRRLSSRYAHIVEVITRISTAQRLARALFEIHLSKKDSLMAGCCLQIAKVLECGQFGSTKEPHQPVLIVEAVVRPIGVKLFSITTYVTPDFSWQEGVHSDSEECFWLWIEDSADKHIYNHTYFQLSRQQVEQKSRLELCLVVTLEPPLPEHCDVWVLSDRWVGCIHGSNLSLDHIILPFRETLITELNNTKCLPRTALKDAQLEKLYSHGHFDSVISRAFHALYSGEDNVLVAAPTNHHKAQAAELAIFAAVKRRPDTKVMFVSPEGPEVAERLEDWRYRLGDTLHLTVQALSEKITANARVFADNQVILGTGRHWWPTSCLPEVRRSIGLGTVSLIILNDVEMMDVHMEALLSHLGTRPLISLRLVALSGATLINTQDLATFLRVPKSHLFNFKGAVSQNSPKAVIRTRRYAEMSQSARATAMVRDVWKALSHHTQSGHSAVVFVPSTRLAGFTAYHLQRCLSRCGSGLWVRCQKEAVEELAGSTEDPLAAVCISYGMGIVHSGMSAQDCRDIRHAFHNQILQVVIVTAEVSQTLRFRSNVVVVEGTERYNPDTRQYEDLSVSAMLRMIQTCSAACHDCSMCTPEVWILAHKTKLAKYQDCLRGHVTLESGLIDVLPGYLLSLLDAGTLEKPDDEAARTCLHDTYLALRLSSNPSYFLCKAEGGGHVSSFLAMWADAAVKTLANAGCVKVDQGLIQITDLGRSMLSNQLCHITVNTLDRKLGADMTLEQVVRVLVLAREFEELLPFRQTERLFASSHSKELPWRLPDERELPQTARKALLLLQVYLLRLRMPESVFTCAEMRFMLVTANSVLQVMVFICQKNKLLNTLLQTLRFQQNMAAEVWGDDSFSELPQLTSSHISVLRKQDKCPITCLTDMVKHFAGNLSELTSVLSPCLSNKQIGEVYAKLCALPRMKIDLRLRQGNKRWFRLGKRPLAMSPLGGYTLEISYWSSHSWTLLVSGTDELLVFRTLNPGALRKEIHLTAPKVPGIATISVHLLAKQHVGLDRLVTFKLDVLPN